MACKSRSSGRQICKLGSDAMALCAGIDIQLQLWLSNCCPCCACTEVVEACMWWGGGGGGFSEKADTCFMYAVFFFQKSQTTYLHSILSLICKIGGGGGGGGKLPLFLVMSAKLGKEASQITCEHYSAKIPHYFHVTNCFHVTNLTQTGAQDSS